jgi:hypothetical protein
MTPIPPPTYRGIDGIHQDLVRYILSISIDALETYAVAAPVRSQGFDIHDQGYWLAILEVDGHGADGLYFNETLWGVVYAVDVARAMKECAKKSDEPKLPFQFLM